MDRRFDWVGLKYQVWCLKEFELLSFEFWEIWRRDGN
jgi:hypothetical protein